MNSNFALAEDLERLNQEYEGKDDFLGVDVLTLTNKVDSVRGTMLGNMLQQAVCINCAEPPRIFTRYENQVGKYSSSYYKTGDHPLEVIEKIQKYAGTDTVYLLIVQDTVTKVYDVIERKEAEHLTESYCYVNKNDMIDTFQQGDEIQPQTILHHSTNFDEYGNYSYGCNVKACYQIDNDTIEDAVKISESLAKRMTTNYLHEVEVSVNGNNLLINIYGDDKEYKSFPDIGEHTNGKILVARRVINNENALFDLKNENVRKINYNSDKLFYSKGKLVDIEIYSNTPVEELEERGYNAQIVKYLKNQTTYYARIIEVMKGILDSGAEVTDAFNHIYYRATNINDPEVVFKNDKTDYDHLLIKFHVLDTIGLHIGSKISGRYGNKGVISKILPDDEMPISEDGVRADMVLNPLGVPNRLNPAQLYEHELNFISDNIVKDMKKMSIAEAGKFYLGYLKDVNTTQYKYTKRFYESLSKADKKEFLNDIMENGISLHQPPFWNNVNLDQLTKLYDKYGYKPYKVFIEGEEVLNPMIIADLYILRLKHEPKGKLSARSTSYINMTNSPSKSLSYKKHEELYSKTPIRIGEMELTNLLLTKNSALQAKFNSFYSNNEINRRYLSEVLLTTKDVLDIKDIKERSTTNGSQILLNVLFKTISIKLDPIYGTKEDT